MAQDPTKKKRKLPEDALEHDDKYLMWCIFGDEIMTELDKITSEKSESDNESFM